MAQATAEESVPAQEEENAPSYFQKWKLGVIGLLAIPGLVTGASGGGALGFAIGTAFGLAILVAIATAVHRTIAKRSPVRLFTSRGWAVYCVGTAILTVPIAIVISAEIGGTASAGGAYGAVFLMLLVPGILISKGLGIAQKRYDLPSLG